MKPLQPKFFWFLLISLALLVAVPMCGDDDDDDDDDAIDDDATDDDQIGDDDNSADDDNTGDDDSGDDDNDTDDDDDGVYVGDGYPFMPGPLNVLPIDLDEGELGAPRPVTIYAPLEPGKYAVIQFQHGFLLDKDYYSDMFNHIASHGFIVVAPQMYEPGGLPLGKPTSEEEAAAAVEVLNWLPSALQGTQGAEMVDGVVGLAGHSRGGKVIWTILKQDNSRAMAVAGVDPVDSNMPGLGEYRVVDGPFGFPYPSLVIGTGYGSQPLIPMVFPACAPEGDNHEQFYGASAAPAYHVIATEQGHLDMLNDDLSECGIECASCKEGNDDEGMRKLTAGLLVAFFRATLQGDASAFDFMVNPDGLPTPVEMEQNL